MRTIFDRGWAFSPVHGAKRWLPSDVFLPGGNGFLYDFSRADALFQEATGITPAGVDQNVGLALDVSKWGGKTLAEVIAASTAVLSDDFSSYADTAAMVAAGWTNATLSSITLENGKLKATNGASGGYCYRSFPTVAGRTYRVSYRQELGTVSTADVVFASTPSGSDILALGSVPGIGNNAAGYFTAVGSTTYLRLRTGSPAGGTAFLDNVEIREIPSIPASQSTSAARPKYDTDNGGCVRADASDDNLLTTYKCAASGNTAAARIKVPASLAATQIVMGASGSSTARFFFGFNTSGHLVGGVGSDSTDTVLDATDYRGVTGTFGLVEDGEEWRLYFDGDVVASGDVNGAPTTSIPCRLFALNNNGTAGSFSGVDAMDMLAIDRALTPAEIARLSSYWSAN